jgi:hypothetical protein
MKREEAFALKSQIQSELTRAEMQVAERTSRSPRFSVSSVRIESATSLIRYASQHEFGRLDFGITRRLSEPFLAELVLTSPALGLARRNGEYLIAILVQSEESDATNTFVDIVSRRSGGEVDVEYAIGIEAQAGASSGRIRPLETGVSIGRVGGPVGTLGCLVTRDGSTVEGLSANHVLAASNLGEIGDEILQPGVTDGGVLPVDRVGELSHFHPLFLPPLANDVDLALFRLDENVAATATSSSKHVVDLEPGDLVQKVGRTTGQTNGEITAVELDGVKIVMPGLGVAIFNGLTRIAAADGQEFSRSGDSGALVTDTTREKGAGIVVAGLQNRTWITPLSTTLQVIGAKLVNYDRD